MEQSRAPSTEHTPSAEPRWIADPSARPVWRNWGDAHYAFDPRSHQTHFLNTLAVEIFHLLGEHAMTQGELGRELVTGYGMDDTAELHEAVAATLNVLDRLGLLVREGGA
jgi:PqqD family protein of HPr-rel-A system